MPPRAAAQVQNPGVTLAEVEEAMQVTDSLLPDSPELLTALLSERDTYFRALKASEAFWQGKFAELRDEGNKAAVVEAISRSRRFSSPARPALRIMSPEETVLADIARVAGVRVSTR